MIVLSLHLYLYDRQDTFLGCTLQGLVAELVRERRLTRYFFLRHWEDGPHLRLRLWADEQDSAQIRTSLVRALEPYREHAAGAQPDLVAQLQRVAAIENVQWHPDQLAPHGTVRDKFYLPEFDKYGGVAGVTLAERVFCESSSIILELLAAKHQHWPTRRFDVAAMMMLYALRAFDVGLDATRQFLFRYSDLWRKYDANVSSSSTPMPAPPALVAKLRAIFGAQRVETSALLTRWTNLLVNARQEIALHSNMLCSQIKIDGRTLTPAILPQYLLMNFIHTHNNRLGLMPSEEAQLASLLGACVAILISERNGLALEIQ